MSPHSDHMSWRDYFEALSVTTSLGGAICPWEAQSESLDYSMLHSYYTQEKGSNEPSLLSLLSISHCTSSCAGRIRSAGPLEPRETVAKQGIDSRRIPVSPRFDRLVLAC